MTKLILLFLVVAILSIRGDPQPRGVFEDADSILGLYQVTVQDVLRKISRTFDETYAHITQTGEAISSIALRIIVKAQNEYGDQLTQLGEDARAQGVDPSACLYGPRLALSRLPGALRIDVESCVNQINRESYYTLSNAFASFDHLNDSVNDYATRLETCRSSNDEVCGMILIAQISLHIELLPIIADGDVQGVLSQFGDMEPYFQTCSRGPTDEIHIQGQFLVLNALACIDNLLLTKP